ncbi:NAD(P)/FAD-dependent oxidoreductase [Arthrobacter sp. SAFR-044]|uniref:NAD(P)/FAD-dependent oxidoreductase n=1 Tax=Arthrobacter sp. SAFR-044 TaxID=3387278 RepID=UPI003F7C92E2
MTTPQPRNILIVGASQAGVQIACSLREFGYEHDITIVGAELHIPYERPPLSKAFLTTQLNHEEIALRTAEFFAQNNIRLELNQRVTHITRDANGHGTATTDTGRTLTFDGLALAVGTRVRKLAAAGQDLNGISYLRDADDASRVRNLLGHASKVLVIGGGFIGLEVAASARTLGKDVDVAIPRDRLLGRAVGAETAAQLRASHEKRGIRFIEHAQVTSFIDNGEGHVAGARLADGRIIDADTVVVGIGAEPRVELAKTLGLDVTDGITVNERCVASDGRTVAAGDCVSVPNPQAGIGPARMRFESVATAIDQARIAAASLIGHAAPAMGVPWFWSNQFDLKLQVAGSPTAATGHVIRGNPAEEKYTILYYAGDNVVAVESVNRPGEFIALKGALQKGRTVPVELASDETQPLKNLLVPAGRTLLAGAAAS